MTSRHGQVAGTVEACEQAILEAESDFFLRFPNVSTHYRSRGTRVQKVFFFMFFFFSE